MGLITEQEKAQLLENGKNSKENPWPVVKLNLREFNFTWLLVLCHPKNDDLVYCVFDWGQGFPILAYSRLSVIESLHTAFFFKVERDKEFKANKGMNEYAFEMVVSPTRRPYDSSRS